MRPLLPLMLCACGAPAAESPEGQGSRAPQTLRLWSPAVEEGGQIPERHTCDGENLPIPLEWGTPPSGTRSFVLIVEDPDVVPERACVHWLVWNIPADARAVPAESGYTQGRNDLGETGWSGPCPPPTGVEHRYIAHLYALDLKLPTKSDLLYDDSVPVPGMRIEDAKAFMKPHLLASGTWMARYQRKGVP